MLTFRQIWCCVFRRAAGTVGMVVLGAAACSPAPDGDSPAGVSGSSSSGSLVGSSSAGASLAGSSSAAGPASSAVHSSRASVGGSTGGPPDPAGMGPHGVTEEDVQRFPVSTTMTNVQLFVAGPTNVTAPVPVVLMAPGLQLPVAQFKNYARQLASHGFVVVLTSYNLNLFAPDHAKAAQEVRGALEFIPANQAWAARADLQTIGTAGHSLGGKLAVVVAAQDPRVKASLTLDPVNGTQMPDATASLPLAIPMAFLGETTDAQASFMACAPAAQNYQTFFSAAGSPALEVTITGANHMSFLDDVSTCGFTCNLCNMATADNAEVNALARAYMVAFFRRHLLGEDAYDTHLDGPAAQARYVTTGKATLRVK